MKRTDSINMFHLTADHQTTMAQLSLVLLCAAYLLIGSMVQMKNLSFQENGRFLTATIGDNISLSCCSEDTIPTGARLWWFKQTIGIKPTLISSFYKYNRKGGFYGEFQNNHRFTPNDEDGKLGLHITNVQKSDSAVYHCISRLGHEIQFLETVTVIVNGMHIEAENTDPGASITLKCTVHTGSCDGEHRVYWFKETEDSHAGVLYSHGDQCERNTDSQSNSCVYNLPIHNVSSEQTGTYYCAVASCGQVLFGNGTTVNVKNGVDFTVYILSGALVFTSVLVLLLIFSLCIMKKKCSSFSSVANKAGGSQSNGLNAQAQNEETDDLHYAAVNINHSSRRQRTMTAQSVCVYSSVHHYD